MPALQPKPDLITLEQYKALPEDVRAEVFEGIVKVNIYDDLYINFSEIAELLSI